MNKENITGAIKRIRLENGLSQEELAIKLNMSRSTYTKLETGRTSISLEFLMKFSRVMDMPLRQVLNTVGDPTFDNLETDLYLMLNDTEYALSNLLIKTKSYSELTSEELKYLESKGIDSKEVYEETPYKGRIFSFDEKDVFEYMMNSCGMRVLFDRNLVQDIYWQNKWSEFQEQKGSRTFKDRFDNHDYFTIYIALLYFPNKKDWLVQFKFDEIPESMSEYAFLDMIVNFFGAYKGDILSFSYDGYTPYTDIVQYNGREFSLIESDKPN